MAFPLGYVLAALPLFLLSRVYQVLSSSDQEPGTGVNALIVLMVVGMTLFVYIMLNVYYGVKARPLHSLWATIFYVVGVGALAVAGYILFEIFVVRDAYLVLVYFAAMPAGVAGIVGLALGEFLRRRASC